MATLTKPVLAKMRTSKIKSLRAKTGLSQTEFCELFHISVDTFKHWECADRTPPFYALVLLDYCVEKYVKGELFEYELEEIGKRIKKELEEEYSDVIR